MPDQGYSNRFIVLYNPETGLRTVMNPIAVDICCSVNDSDKTVSELSERLDLPATTVQDIISKMLKEGLLIRFKDKQDSRKTRYHPAYYVLLSDSTFYRPVIGKQESVEDSYGIYQKLCDNGVDIWPLFGYIGIKLEYRVDELIVPRLDYSKKTLIGAMTRVTGSSKVDIDWEEPFILKMNTKVDSDYSMIFEQAILSCALVKAIRNNTEKHYQYRPQIHSGREGRNVSLIYYPFKTKLGVDEQTQYLMKNDCQSDARRKTVYSLEDHTYIFSNELMSDILEILSKQDSDLSEITQKVGKQKMTVINALGKLMEIGFVTLKDPMKKRNRVYHSKCRKVLEINPRSFCNDPVKEERFWQETDVCNFKEYLQRAYAHVLDAAGIRIFV